MKRRETFVIYVVSSEKRRSRVRQTEINAITLGNLASSF